jgi:hypothetical protein
MFPVGNIDLLALSLAMLVANPRFRSQLGLAAQKTAQRYTPAAFFSQLDNIITTVVGG